MTEPIDIEHRLVRTLETVALSVPERPPTTLRESRRPNLAPAAAPSTRRWASRRWRLAAVVGLAVTLGGVGTGAAAAVGAFSPPSTRPPPPAGAVRLGPRPIKPPPPPQDTTGTTIPPATILNTAVLQLPGVTRSAIKTMPYNVIESALAAVGLGGTGNPQSTWTPVVPSDPVDVVVQAGDALYPPGSGRDAVKWVVTIIDPVTGGMIAQSGTGVQGAWPLFFDALPGEG